MSYINWFLHYEQDAAARGNAPKTSDRNKTFLELINK